MVSVGHTKIVAHAIQAYVAILQINGDSKVQNKDVIALLTVFVSTMINPIRPHKLWHQIKTINPFSFSVGFADFLALPLLLTGAQQVRLLFGLEASVPLPSAVIAVGSL